jgi:hypothetical protein
MAMKTNCGVICAAAMETMTGAVANSIDSGRYREVAHISVPQEY